MKQWKRIILEQLGLAKEYEKLEKEKELLERENRALADDNELKCELNEELNKALKKLCKRQAKTGFCHGKTKSSDKCRDKEYCAKCWYKYAMKED